MTSHGWFFGEATAKTTLLDIAKRVSKENGVKTVHLVTGGGPYDIMIEFDFESQPYSAFRDLLSFLLGQGIHNIDTWFGLESFKQGISQE